MNNFSCGNLIGNVGLKAYPTFREMLEAVVEGRVDRGMLPIENTTAGSVYEAYDLLLRYNLSLVGEEIVDVRHCLLGVADVPVAAIKRIHSHPQALAQCSEFLAGLPSCEGVAAANVLIDRTIDKGPLLYLVIEVAIALLLISAL